MTKQVRSNLTGFLVVDKPHGPSSMDVIRVVRRKAGGAKTGHAGTLDPLATGVMIVCIGRGATRCVPRLMDAEKGYRAWIDFSSVSETEDAEGPVVAVELARDEPSFEEVWEILGSRFTGEIMQKPPRHSAMWVEGKRAYKMARKGEEFEMEARRVVVHEIAIVEYSFPELVIDVRCGKGMYVRSLARDVGVALGAGGYLTGLRRTAVGEFRVEDAVRLDDVPEELRQEDLIDVSVLGGEGSLWGGIRGNRS